MILQLRPVQGKEKPQVAFWQDFFSGEELNYILSLPEWMNQEAAMVGSGNPTSPSIVDEKVRRTDVSWLQKDERTSFIYERIAAVVENVNAEHFGFDLTGFYEPIQLGFYTSKNSGFYSWHIDSIPDEKNRVARKLSMALMLDDPKDFEGGELLVKTNSDEPITLEQQRGRAWFFPSYILHTVTPVTKGIRRSLVLWVGGPAFK